MPTSQPDEHSAPQPCELVNEAIKGDQIAFNQLYAMFFQGIFSFFFIRLKNTMDAQDMCQEVFMKAHKKLSHLDKPESFKSWLFSIAMNTLRDHHRKARLLSFLGLFEDHTEDELEKCTASIAYDPAQQAIRRQFWEQMKRFEKQLSAHEREVFLLRFYDELSISEIASALESNESTIKTHLYRAIKKFKDAPELHGFIRIVGKKKNEKAG